MHILATFLGGGPNRGYRPAKYRFEDGRVYETPLLAWALMQHLRSQGESVDKLVVFGTPTSFWEHLLEVAHPGHEQKGELGRMAQAGISRRELAPFAAPIRDAAGAFGVSEVRLELIDYLDTSEAQMALIGQIADLLGPDDTLRLDITHGLRHQPSIGTLAAMALRTGGHVGSMSGVHYGAYDLTRDGETPVLRLDPLLEYADWISAQAKAEATGDYGPIAERFRSEGVDPIACDALADGSFLLAIGNYQRAADKFAEWRRRIGSIALRGAGALFVGKINARIGLLPVADLPTKMMAEGREALQRGSLARAAELILEAATQFLAQHGIDAARDENNPNSYTQRFDGWRRGRNWGAIAHFPQARWRQAFERVRRMRNAIAHLDFEEHDPRIAAALQSRAAAARALNEDFETLFFKDLKNALTL